MSDFFRVNLPSVACLHVFEVYHCPRGSWWGLSTLSHDVLEAFYLAIKGDSGLFKEV